VYEVIKNLRPYFHSLREIESNVSLDIKLPLSWQFNDIVQPYSSIKFKVQDKNDKFTLLSLISVNNQEGYDIVFACALEIITINKEEEEKQNLFKQKVKELESLFKKEKLDKLKSLNLNIDVNEQELEIRDGAFRERKEEESIGDRLPQEKVDKRDKSTRQKQNV
jgi:hypothetical protein